VVIFLLEKLIVAHPINRYFLYGTQRFCTVYNSLPNQMDTASTFRIFKALFNTTPYTPTSCKWSRQVNDSDVPTTSSGRQLRTSAIVFTSDSETREESSEPESSDDRSDVWCKTYKKPSNEPFPRPKVQNIVIDNPESTVAVMCYGTWRGSRKYEYNRSIYSITKRNRKPTRKT
jgi:hypothetical protein